MRGPERRPHRWLPAVCLLAWIPTVQAQLLDGTIVETTYFRGLQPDQTTIIGPVSSRVGPELELVAFAGFLDIDFSDTNILLTVTQAPPFSYFELARFTTGPAIAELTINPATDYSGLERSDINIQGDGHIIDLNLTALPALPGQVISLDLTGAAVVPAGAVLASLRVDAQGAGLLTSLEWDPSCAPGDTDYAIYAGQIGDFENHSALFCTTGGATAKVFATSPGSFYYLVVPKSATREGSYGQGSDLAQRRQGAPACSVQDFVPCG